MKDDTEFDLASKQVVKGVGSALGTVNGIFKVPKDKSVRIYKQLKSNDFAAITAKFGPEVTMEYIRRMETRLAKK